MKGRDIYGIHNNDERENKIKDDLKYNDLLSEEEKEARYEENEDEKYEEDDREND